MAPAPKFSWLALACFLFVVASAGATRSWYLLECAGGGWYAPVLQVQGEPPGRPIPDGTTIRARTLPNEYDQLAANIAEHHWFGSQTPLFDKEELTAHTAPGYPWLLGFLMETTGSRADWAMRWLQCLLGSLTAGCYFLFARRASHSTVIACIAGVLTAVYPFWIINTGEINDGVLTGFLLSLALLLGTHAGQTGGAITGFLFGAALAGLCMVRAACLPFAIVAAIWFLWRCRRFPVGYLSSVLLLVGFINGLAPWAVRNYQNFEHPVPIVTTTYYHLWMGNNPRANGMTLDEKTARATLGPNRLKELLDEPKQAMRYNQLVKDVRQEIEARPTATVSRRFNSTLAFFFGDWFTDNHFTSLRDEGENTADIPHWLKIRADHILNATFLGLLILALLGWRVSYPWRVQARLATIAAICIPLPYILAHAEALSGPRLPMDGVLMFLAAHAIASIIPGLPRNVEATPAPAEK